VWEEASTRLSERSGRTALKCLDRVFEVPVCGGEVELVIHEPSMTADNLGLKTWAASYCLAKRFVGMELEGRLLELGAGTGLVGMAAAAACGADVLLTDLPEIQENLVKNLERNRDVIQSGGGRVSAAILDWENPTSLDPARNDKFPIILAADVVYSLDHPRMIADVIEHWLSPGRSSRVIFELPRRSGFEEDLKAISTEMNRIGLEMLEEEEDTGYDDWGSQEPDDEAGVVHCWFSVWARKQIY
jgi:hypothetical protein